jgi:tetratricopeptide (TPR) repeat protein
LKGRAKLIYKAERMRQHPRDMDGKPPRRRSAFRVAAAILPALALCGGLELALRLGHYGYPARFFLKGVEGGHKVLRDNPRFTWRFMPPALARWPLPIQVSAEKPFNSLRILVFGESAAMGDPEPAFGFSRVLRVLLEARYPGRRIEVVNTAYPAINSHVIREIARDGGRAQADFWVVYMGNNEVLGPYGLTTAFGARAPRWLTIRAGLLLRELRTGQLLGELAARLGPPANLRASQENLTKNPVERDDPGLARVYRHFEQNLTAIISAGNRAGARVLVNTMVSNLKDCAPFLPARRPQLPGAQLAAWEGLLRDGQQALAQGNTAQALSRFNQAAELEPRHAELQYQLGRARLALGQTNEARRCLECARDLDGFRARADSKLNEIIRLAAARHDSERVRLIDAEQAFGSASPNGVTGDELLCDHVHFRFAGSYLLARLQAEAIAAWLPPATNSAALWLTLQECADRLALSDWNRYRLAAAERRQLATPLFRAQSNRAEREARLRRELLSLERANRPEELERSLRVFRQAIGQSPQDWLLYDQLGKRLFASGDRAGAANAWSNVVRLVPHAFIGHYQLGLLLNQPGTARAAARHLQAALELRPCVPEVHAALGTAHTLMNQLSAADAAFRRALALDPDNEPARIAWAQSLRARNDLAGARAQLEKAVAANTNSLAAHLHLARLLNQEGQPAAASVHLREVLRLDPRNEEARRFLADPKPVPAPSPSNGEETKGER